MKSLYAALAYMLFAAAIAVAEDGAQPMQCDRGGAIDEFGGTDWIVYGCNDDHSVAIFSATGDPAMSFYFILSPDGESYRLYGEGTGDKTYTQRAYDQLSALGSSEIQSLVTSAQGQAKTSD